MTRLTTHKSPHPDPNPNPDLGQDPRVLSQEYGRGVGEDKVRAWAAAVVIVVVFVVVSVVIDHHHHHHHRPVPGAVWTHTGRGALCVRGERRERRRGSRWVDLVGGDRGRGETLLAQDKPRHVARSPFTLPA